MGPFFWLLDVARRAGRPSSISWLKSDVRSLRSDLRRQEVITAELGGWLDLSTFSMKTFLRGLVVGLVLLSLPLPCEVPIPHCQAQLPAIVLLSTMQRELQRAQTNWGS